MECGGPAPLCYSNSHVHILSPYQSGARPPHSKEARSAEMILRGLAGLLVGSGYGLVVGTVTFFLVWLTSNRPGPMIPDNTGWGELVLTYATFSAGLCGAVVGLVVGLTGAGKVRATIIGGAIGLMIFSFFMLEPLRGLTELSWPMWKEFLKLFVTLLLFLPIGLGLTGRFVSMIARNSKH